MNHCIKYTLGCWVAGLAMLTSCGSDWLDTEPTDQTGTVTVFETTEMAQAAVQGLCKLMSTPYPYYANGALASQDFNGEGTIKMIYGNWPGNYFVWANRDGYAALFKGTNYMSNPTSIYDYYPWWYYYMIVGNANTIIENIDGAVGPESERQFILAQALTFRAYCYTMLGQIYGYRWVDTNSGATDGVVLRIDTSSDSQGLCTMGELYAQIYADLNEAISLYTSSGLKRAEDDNYSPDLAVAYAVYARAALNRQDYQTALTMAQQARADYPLMDNAAYKAGFNTPTSEWIWSSYSSEAETLGYYSFFSKMGYNTVNGNFTARPFCINCELYDPIPATDMRRDLFLDPKDDYFLCNTGAGGLYEGWAPEGFPLYDRAFETFSDMPTTHSVYAYMQFKFKSLDGIGVGHLNHFRSSEMVLIEAEAAYFLNQPTQAQNALLALNRDSGRDPEYTCTLTGEALLDEIKRYRALELWGEGFDWFDMKRWNDPIDRKTYANGGNFSDRTAFTTAVDENNRWTWVIPDLESDFNDEL